MSRYCLFASLACGFVLLGGGAGIAGEDADQVSLEWFDGKGQYLYHKDGQAFVGRMGAMPALVDGWFKKVKGLADPKGVSLESSNHPEHYLRHKDGRLVLSRCDEEGDKKDATFFLVKGLASEQDGWMSLELLTHPGFFVHCSKSEVWVGKKMEDEAYSKGATFRLVKAVSTEKRKLAEARVRSITRQIMDLDSIARTKVLHAENVKPAHRAPANVVYNMDEFDPVKIRFVRFTILATLDGMEPCLDELEIYGEGGDNLALARGAKATASSSLTGYPGHKADRLNDGQHGAGACWISNEKGKGWAQIELPEEAKVSRVIWSRDGNGPGRFLDRLTTAYRIEVSPDGEFWKTVATGEDRIAPGKDRWLSEKRLFDAMDPDQQKKRRDLAADLKKAREALQEE